MPFVRGGKCFHIKDVGGQIRWDFVCIILQMFAGRDFDFFDSVTHNIVIYDILQPKISQGSFKNCLAYILRPKKLEQNMKNVNIGVFS